MIPACPTPRELLSLRDGDLAENRAQLLRRHLAVCPRCVHEDAAQRQLLARVAAPVPGLGGREGVAAVMARLDGAAPAPAPVPLLGRWSGRALGGGALAAVAAASLLVAVVRRDVPGDPGRFAPRGGPVEWSRRIGVELWALEGAPRRIEPGGAMSTATPIVASYTNVDVAPAWLLAFAVDARSQLHWLYPAFVDPATDPAAVRLEPSGRHQPFADAVAFDDLPPGPLRFVTIVSREPLRVSDVERLRPEELLLPALHARWPAARIDELPYSVHLAPGERMPR